ncbi:MAG: hypothetical protein ACI8T1_001353 [Verrucomicrobiales bacterium]|jgi:hypothetical protein
MNNPDNSADLSPEEAALESELVFLRASSLRPGLREEILEPLSARPGDDVDFVAQALGDRLMPIQPPVDLWARIESRMTEPGEEESNIVSVPRWRDFAPVFKVAAVIAIGVLAAGVWLQSDQPGQTTSVIRKPAVTENFLGTGKVELVSRRGEVHPRERKGVVKKDEQLYETYRQLSRDHSLYRLDNGVHVEDEVSRERQVYTPLPTF